MSLLVIDLSLFCSWIFHFSTLWEDPGGYFTFSSLFNRVSWVGMISFSTSSQNLILFHEFKQVFMKLLKKSLKLWTLECLENHEALCYYFFLMVEGLNREKEWKNDLFSSPNFSTYSSFFVSLGKEKGRQFKFLDVCCWDSCSEKFLEYWVLKEYVKFLENEDENFFTISS